MSRHRHSSSSLTAHLSFNVKTLHMCWYFFVKNKKNNMTEMRIRHISPDIFSNSSTPAILIYFICQTARTCYTQELSVQNWERSVGNELCWISKAIHLIIPTLKTLPLLIEHGEESDSNKQPNSRDFECFEFRSDITFHRGNLLRLNLSSNPTKAHLIRETNCINFV
jgi:hypothetical protein